LTIADFNGDGPADLAASAPGYDADPDASVTSSGAVYVYAGSAGPLHSDQPAIFSQLTSGVISEPERNDSFGAALVAGDFNGDPAADLVVGVPGESVGPTVGGAVNVLVGSPQVSPAPAVSSSPKTHPASAAPSKRETASPLHSQDRDRSIPASAVAERSDPAGAPPRGTNRHQPSPTLQEPGRRPDGPAVVTPRALDAISMVVGEPVELGRRTTTCRWRDMARSGGRDGGG
jgi:hypothetical protein